MKYSKSPISYNEQVRKLRERGLEIPDEEYAELCLSNISYYRLRAYTFPFQINSDEEHPFMDNTSFDDVINLYTFDRKLRILILDAIEKIEISFRTQIIHTWAISYGSHWQLDQNLFRNSTFFQKNLESLRKEINRASETFIKHYSSKYDSPKDPPSWMSLEVSSFGLLSLIFSNLQRGPEKKVVMNHFGVYKVELIENWMHALSNIRNICAHHGRLWNRRLTTHIEIPRRTRFNYINNRNIINYKLYAAITIIAYILDITTPKSNFKKDLIDLLSELNQSQLKEMGFPKNWDKDEFWK